MTFQDTDIPGLVIVDIDPFADERGMFARVWSADAFAERGLRTDFVQANLGHSVRRGTLRGLHYQEAPFAEAKLVRCTRGAIFDVAVDLRRDSPAYGRWVGLELTAESRRMVYVPEGCAHGYQTLVDDTELFYPVTARYAADAERGVRYDDPAFGIEWPVEVTSISKKDQSWPNHSL